MHQFLCVCGVDVCNINIFMCVYKYRFAGVSAYVQKHTTQTHMQKHARKTGHMSELTEFRRVAFCKKRCTPQEPRLHFAKRAQQHRPIVQRLHQCKRAYQNKALVPKQPCTKTRHLFTPALRLRPQGPLLLV